MAATEEGFKVVFRGDSDSLETASASAATSIGNVLKAAAKVSGVDPFKGLTSSASKSAGNISSIAAGLKSFQISYDLPDFSPLTRLVQATQKDINKAFVTVLPTPGVKGFTTTIRSAVDTAIKEVSSLQNTRVNMGAIRPPDLSPLVRAVETAKANIQAATVMRFSSLDLKPPVLPAPDLSLLTRTLKEAQTDVATTKLQLPTVKIPTIAPIKAPAIDEAPFVRAQSDLTARVQQINKLFAGVNNQPIPAPRIESLDVKPLYNAVDEVKKKIADVRFARINFPKIEAPEIPPVNRKVYDGSISALQGSVQRVNEILASASDTPIQVPAVLPPNLQPLIQAVAKAKATIESVRLIQMPSIGIPEVPALDSSPFDNSVKDVRSKVLLVNKLFTGVSDTPINAPALVPFDVAPLQKAVDTSKRLLRDTARLSLPQITTPEVKPIDIAPYRFSLQTLEQRTAEAQKVISKLSALDVPAPVLQPPSLGPLFDAVQTAKKSIAAIPLKLDEVQVPRLEPIEAPVIQQGKFLASANELTKRVAQVNTAFTTVNDNPIIPPVLLPPDISPITDAVTEAKRRIDAIKFLPVQMPVLQPIEVPAADTSRFTGSMKTVQTVAERIDTLLHSFENVQVPAVKPPDLRSLESVVADARLNIDRTFLEPIPLTAFTNLSRNVQSIITGLAAQDIQVPFAIQQPDLSNVRSGIEAAKRTIQDSLNINIPAPTIAPIPAPKTTAYESAVQGAIRLINELSSAAGNVTTAVKPPDLTAYKAAITAVRNDLQNATLVKVPPVDAKDFYGSITPLQKSIQAVNLLLQGLEGQAIQTPTVLPPDLRPLRQAIQQAKAEIQSVRRFEMPAVTVQPVPPLDYRAFDASSDAISTKVQQVNKLFTTVSDTPINAPALVPFDTRPLLKAVAVSKQALAEVEGLSLPTIETPHIRPLDTAPYENSLTTLQRATLAAQKVIANISTLDVPAPVLNPPSLQPLFTAVQQAKKTLSGIDLVLPKVTVTPIEPITAPKIDTADFVSSASDLQARVRSLNGLFKSVDNQPIPAPAIQAINLAPLRQAVQEAKEMVAAVRFQQIRFPKIEAIQIPLVDQSAFERSVSLLPRVVQQANQVLQSVSDSPIPTPALLPPDLQPLQAAIQKAKAQIESVRLIQMPKVELPTVAPLDTRSFDSSVVDIRTKIQNINRLFNTVSDTPINAPALIPFNVKPLQHAVEQAKREINEAANLKLPTLAVPTINGLRTTEFNKSVGLLQQQVALANSYLQDYGKTVIPTPVLPVPNLRPLFNAVATAKENIERSGTIKLPPVDMPTLQRVVIPPVETAAFDASTNNLQSRVAAINDLFKTVSRTPIIPPALQPPDTKPLYTAVADVKKEIASIRFARIDFPTIARVSVPPVEHEAFDRSTVDIATRLQEVSKLLVQSKAEPFIVPAPVVPDLGTVKAFVRDVQGTIDLLSNMPAAKIDPPLVQPLNLAPFDASKGRLETSVIGIHNILHSISAEPIAPPAIRPPDLSALKDAVEKTRIAIANAADLRLPSIAAITLPAIDQSAFNGSFNLIQSKIAAVNNLFESVNTTPIQAPVIAPPNLAPVVKAASEGVAQVTQIFRNPLHATGVTNAANEILVTFQKLNDQKLNVPFSVPDTANVINQVQAAKDNIEKIWQAPVQAPKLTVDIPPIPPIPALPMPPLDATNYLASIQAAIQEVRANAAKGFSFELITDNHDLFIDIQHIIDKIQKEKIEIPVTFENADAGKVTGPLKQIQKTVDEINDTPLHTDTRQSIQSIAALEKELGELRESLRNATSLVDIAKFNNAISVTQGKINNLQNIRDPFQKFKNTLGGASNSVLNFGRVVQDLPFAFQNFGAIANNIDPLFESFTRLREEAKATGVSLSSSLLAALSGPAGIGLAISAVTSLVTVFSMGLFDNKDAVTEDTAVLDAMNKRLKESKEAFDSVISSIELMNRLGAINIEISGLGKVLDLQGQSVSNREAIQQSMQRESQLWKDLQTAQADFNAASVTTNWMGVADSVTPAKQYVDALNAANDALREQQKETAKLQGDQTVLYREIALQRVQDARKAAEEAQSKLPKPEFNFFDKFFDFDPASFNLSQRKINDLLSAAIAFRKEFGSGAGLRIDIPDFQIMKADAGLNAARTFWTNFQKGIVQFKPATIVEDFTIIPNIRKDTTLEDFINAEKQSIEKFNGERINLRPDITYDIDRKNILQNFAQTFKSIGRQIPKLVESGGFDDRGAKIKIPIEAVTNLDQLTNALKAASFSVKDTLESLNDLVQKSVQDMMTQVAAGIGEAIGVALANGDFSNVLKGVFATIGSAIAELGKQIIALSPLITSVKMALRTLSPAGMLAAGVGLVAIGSAMRTAFTKSAHLKEGGIIPNGFEGDRFPAMLNSREAVIPLDKLDRYINMPQAAGNTRESIRVRGRDLELVRVRNNNYDRRNR